VKALCVRNRSPPDKHQPKPLPARDKGRTRMGGKTRSDEKLTQRDRQMDKSLLFLSKGTVEGRRALRGGMATMTEN